MYRSSTGETKRQQCGGEDLSRASTRPCGTTLFMDNTNFPAWVRRSAVLAMARVLCRRLKQQHLRVSAGETEPRTAGGNDKMVTEVRKGASSQAKTETVTGVRHVDPCAQPLTSVLEQPGVARLMELSQLKKIVASQSDVTVKNAPALIALMAFAAECRSLPLSCTTPFFKECVTLYAALMTRLSTKPPPLGVDARGFVASMVSCILELRCRCNDNEHVRDFGDRNMDMLMVSCLPPDLEMCVGNPISHGVLVGISLSKERSCIHLGTPLMNRLNGLADSLMMSQQREDPHYMQFLCDLVEALSCVCGAPHSRLHEWCLPLLQPKYILRGLRRKGDLHARLVAMTLKLLTKRMREEAGKGACSLSAFVACKAAIEGETAGRIVWETLRSALSKWEKLQSFNTVVHGDNLLIILKGLLQAELGRIYCYRIVSKACNETLPVGRRQKQQKDQISSSPCNLRYLPSPEEVAARVQVVSNIMKFLLLPSSAFSASATSDSVEYLRQHIAEQAVRAIASIVSTESSTAAGGTRVRFTNKFYCDVEHIAHELILCTLRQGSPGTLNTFDGLSRGSLVALCLQGLCATNAHLRTFASTELLDSVLHDTRTRYSVDEPRGTDSGLTTSTSGTVESSRFSVCFEMMVCVLVSRHQSLYKPLPCEGVMRFVQLLFDTVEDTLRTRILAGNLLDPSEPFLSDKVRVIADIFWNLVRRVHDRLAMMMQRALKRSSYAPLPYGEWNESPLIKALNEERTVIRLLLRAVLRCMINCGWPGSGILCTKSMSRKEKRSHYHECLGNRRAALELFLLFFKPLCLLCRLVALLPVKDPRGIARYHGNAQKCVHTTGVDSFLCSSCFQFRDVNPAPYEDSDVAQLRSYWLMLTYYGFTFEVATLAEGAETAPMIDLYASTVKYPQWGKRTLTWQQAKQVRLFASLLPPLMRMRSTDYQQVMSDIGTLRQNLGKPTADNSCSKPNRKELLGSLRACCPAVCHVGRRLPFPELFLLSALSALEIIRASCGSIPTVTQYHRFEICEFDASEGFHIAITYLTAAATEKYLSALQGLSPDVVVKKIDTDARHLVMIYGFSVKSVRDCAKGVLERVVSTFPSQAAVSKALPLLWRVVDLLEKGTAAEVASFCETMQLPGAPAVNPNTESPERRKQLDDVVSFARYWARLAEQGFLPALRESAASFIVEKSSRGAFTSGIGLQLANHAYSAGSVPTGLQQECEQSLVGRSNAKGHVRALSGLAPHGGAGEVLAKHIGRAGKALVASMDVTRQCGLTADALEDHRQAQQNALQEMDTSICSAAAFLLTAKPTASVRMDLLKCVVQYPIHSFSGAALGNAIGCWKWILFERPAFYAVPLLAQVAEGFVWTITRRIGIFDGFRPRNTEKVATGSAAGLREGEEAHPQNCGTSSPHKLLVDFLFTCYVHRDGAVQSAEPVLLLLKRLATRVVKDPSLLSTKDASFSEMMRLVMLLGCVCRRLQDANDYRAQAGGPALVPPASVGALRQGWYRCLLQWFQKMPPSWYFSQDRAAAEAELSTMNELLEILDADRDSLLHSSAGFFDFVSPTEQNASSTNLTFMGNRVGRGLKMHVASHDCGKGPRAVGYDLITEGNRLVALIELLRLLVAHERHRLRLWLCPCEPPDGDEGCHFDISQDAWLAHCRAAAGIDPAVLVSLAARFPNKYVVGWAAQLVSDNPEAFCATPESVELYLNNVVLVNGYSALHLFGNCGVVQALRFLHPQYASRYPQVRVYALRSLLSKRGDVLTFYLPQILQVLKTDQTDGVATFLKDMCQRDWMFMHQLIWSLRAEEEKAGSGVPANKCAQLASEIYRGLDARARAFHDHEFNFIDKLVSVSGEMKLIEKPLRKNQLRLRLRDAEFHDPIQRHRLYLPTEPKCRIVELIPESAGAMQSAAKCPIMIQFRCVGRGPDEMKVAPCSRDDNDAQKAGTTSTKLCIFKMGDDCRQDQLALQLIALFCRIFESIDLPHFLYPYRVVATGKGCGVIECVPNAMSRDQIGKLVEGNLSEYFVQTYGHPESETFRRARECFIRSMASYAVASFVLNVKDRHNGNILIDPQGHLVHIDFGFLFDYSPGGDMNFESSPFKLTLEMAQLMGHNVHNGRRKRQQNSLASALVDRGAYSSFVNLAIRCFLAVRHYGREICVLVELMLGSGFPCFKLKKTILNLSKRLALQKSELQAADFMRKCITNSRENLRTVLYDQYQNYAEGIEM